MDSYGDCLSPAKDYPFPTENPCFLQKNDEYPDGIFNPNNFVATSNCASLPNPNDPFCALNEVRYHFGKELKK